MRLATVYHGFSDIIPLTSFSVVQKFSSVFNHNAITEVSIYSIELLQESLEYVIKGK